MTKISKIKLKDITYDIADKVSGYVTKAANDLDNYMLSSDINAELQNLRNSLALVNNVSLWNGGENIELSTATNLINGNGEHSLVMVTEQGLENECNAKASIVLGRRSKLLDPDDRLIMLFGDGLDNVHSNDKHISMLIVGDFSTAFQNNNKIIFGVANGLDNDNRSMAMTVDYNGNVDIQHSLEIGSGQQGETFKMFNKTKFRFEGDEVFVDWLG